MDLKSTYLQIEMNNNNDGNESKDRFELLRKRSLLKSEVTRSGDDISIDLESLSTKIPFPVQLHKMLTESEQISSKVIRWRSHGRAFKLYDIQKFEEELLPKYFGLKKYVSFQQHLDSYGFRRLTFGRDYGAYYHALFLRGCPDLCKGIDLRSRNGEKLLSEINLYSLPYIGIDGEIMSNACYSSVTELEQRKRFMQDMDKIAKSEHKKARLRKALLKSKKNSSDDLNSMLSIKHGIKMSDHPLDKVPFFLPLEAFCD